MSFAEKIKSHYAVLADIYNYGKYRPSENAIWFQHQGDLRAEVALVNNKYRFEIFDTAYGMRKLVSQGYGASLSLAKKAVLKFFDEHK